MPKGIKIVTRNGDVVYLDVCYPDNGGYTLGNSSEAKRGKKRDILVYVRNDQDEIMQTVRFGKGLDNAPDTTTHKLYGSKGSARSAFLKIKPVIIKILENGEAITQQNMEARKKDERLH